MMIPPEDQALIECAKCTWADIGDYDLESWAICKCSSFAVEAFGRPRRAKQDYLHVFIFEHFWDAGHCRFCLRTIGKTP